MSSITKALQRNILVGLLLVLPIGLTLWITNVLFNFVTETILPEHLLKSGSQLQLKALTLLIVLMILFLVGLFARSFFGKKLYRAAERAVIRIPFINRLYITIRQVTETLVAQRQTLFREVVMVEYPRKGLYCMAFVTAVVPPSMKEQMTSAGSEEQLLALFIPTTPNPTSGVLIFAPRSETKKIHVDVGNAMKLVVSAGAVYPGDPRLTSDYTPSLLDKLEELMSKDGKSGEKTPLPSEDPS